MKANSLKKRVKEIAPKISHPARFPDFLIIGVQKGGTSSLFHYLSQHPSVSLPKTKEIHYYDLYYEKGPEWYKSHFLIETTTITGEASPYYLFHPLVAKRVYKDHPAVKLIVMLRDPTTRAYSHYQMEKKRGFEVIDSFEKAIESEGNIIDQETELIKQSIIKISKKHLVSSYLSRGAYAMQIKEWFKYFKKEQFLFIKSEDFFKDPIPVLNEVTTFLGVQPFIPADLAPKNTSEYDEISLDTKGYLESYFKKANEELRQMIGDKFQWNNSE